MTQKANWHDLLPRVASAIVLIAAGAIEIYFGGWLFLITVCAVCGVMVWEAGRMFGAPRPRADGVLAGSALFVSILAPPPFFFLMILASAFVSVTRAARDRRTFFAFYVWILIACYAIVLLRDLGGFTWFFWAISVIAVTDIGGYFAGRLIGGPKFWPAISPKKTWSGTVAGWVMAAGVGAFMMAYLDVGALLIAASVLVSFAAQIGDIAESAIKRRSGVKDSSNLIPGHGGVLDRFDGVMGGGFFALGFWAVLSPAVSA
ncbi:MAG: phosphatidate cytidylyltransferase [Pseudomonadota bacterium]